MANILLVEDDSDVQTIVSEFLATLGHRVTSASSAEQARCFLASEPVDLALVDCLMEGEQGSSLAEHAFKLGIPTILTSGDPHVHRDVFGASFSVFAKAISFEPSGRADRKHVAQVGDRLISIVTTGISGGAKEAPFCPPQFPTGCNPPAPSDSFDRK